MEEKKTNNADRVIKKARQLCVFSPLLIVSQHYFTTRTGIILFFFLSLVCRNMGSLLASFMGFHECRAEVCMRTFPYVFSQKKLPRNPLSIAATDPLDARHGKVDQAGTTGRRRVELQQGQEDA